MFIINIAHFYVIDILANYVDEEQYKEEFPCLILNDIWFAWVGSTYGQGKDSSS